MLRLLQRLTVSVFEEAEQLAAQHGVVVLPRADRRLLAASLQFLFTLQHAFHLGRWHFGRQFVLVFETLRVAPRLETQRSLRLLLLPGLRPEANAPSRLYNQVCSTVRSTDLFLNGSSVRMDNYVFDSYKNLT